MSFSNYLEEALLEHLAGIDTFTSPTIYLGLSSTTPEEDGSNITEPTGGSYARVETSSEDWEINESGQLTNATLLQFPQASADWVDQSDLTHVVAFDASTNGNFLFSGAFIQAKPVLNGDTAAIPPGDLVITLD